MNSCSPEPISLTALRSSCRPLNMARVLGRQEWLSREGAEYKPTPNEEWPSASVTENVLQINYTERGGMKWHNEQPQCGYLPEQLMNDIWRMITEVSSASYQYLSRHLVPAREPVNRNYNYGEDNYIDRVRTTSCYVSRGVECPWSALGGLVLQMVSPSYLSHSYTPSCAAANPNAAK